MAPERVVGRGGGPAVRGSARWCGGVGTVKGMEEMVRGTAVHAAVHAAAGGFCDACFTGRYPIVHDERAGRPQLPLFRP